MGIRKERQTYRVLEHTADIGIEAKGLSIAEAFEACATGMFDLISDTGKIEPSLDIPVDLDAGGDEALLVDFLNELLYLGESHEAVFSQVDLLEKTPGRLRAVVHGEPIDHDKHELRHDIKACTYHQLGVWEEGGFWHARVIFDV